MFKLIFKIISSIVIILVIIVVLVIWKGGAPFTWVGKKIVNIGRSVEKFGTGVDDLIYSIKRGQKKASDNLIKFKEDLDYLRKDKKPENNKSKQ